MLTRFRLAAQIDVGFNCIDQATSLELLAAMKGKSLVRIGMAKCSLGVEGVKVVAEMASVMASLTSIDLRMTTLGDGGLEALQKAVEGRSGFKLTLR